MRAFKRTEHVNNKLTGSVRCFGSDYFNASGEDSSMKYYGVWNNSLSAFVSDY